MTRAVFFDLGKVLVDFDWTRPMQRAGALCDAGAAGIQKWFVTSTDPVAYETGLLTTEQFFENIRTAWGFRASFDEFSRIWSDIFTAKPDSLALLRELRGTVPLCLLSNTNEMHIEWIEKQFDILPCFDEAVYSCREHVMKPKAEIFRNAVARMKVSPDEAFFMDDRPENVEGALAAGMDAVVFTTAAAMRKEMQIRGILR